MRKVVDEGRVILDEQTLAINSRKGQGCYLEILVALKSQLDAMLSHHSSVLFLRMDVRQYEYSDSNKVMSDFFRKLKKLLSRRYKTKRIAYLWVRELEKASQQHYHLVLMLDGHKVRHPAKIIEVIEGIAKGWDWPKPYTPKNCYYLVRRGDVKSYEDAFYRASYLAKPRGKFTKGLLANNYGRSNLKGGGR